MKCPEDHILSIKYTKKIEQKILQTIHDKLTELKLSIELKNSLSFREDFIEIAV